MKGSAGKGQLQVGGSLFEMKKCGEHGRVTLVCAKLFTTILGWVVTRVLICYCNFLKIVIFSVLLLGYLGLLVLGGSLLVKVKCQIIFL